MNNFAIQNKFSSSYSPLAEDKSKSPSKLFSTTYQETNIESNGKYSNKFDSNESKSDDQKDLSLTSTSNSKNEFSSIISNADYFSALKDSSAIQNKQSSSFSLLDPVNTKTSTTFDTFSLTNQALNNNLQSLYSNKIDPILSKSVDQKEVSLISRSDSINQISKKDTTTDYVYPFLNYSNKIDEDHSKAMTVLNTFSQLNKATHNESIGLLTHKIDSNSVHQKDLSFSVDHDTRVIQNNFLSDFSPFISSQETSSNTFNAISMTNQLFYYQSQSCVPQYQYCFPSFVSEITSQLCHNQVSHFYPYSLPCQDFLQQESHSLTHSCLFYSSPYCCPSYDQLIYCVPDCFQFFYTNPQVICPPGCIPVG